MARVQSRTKKTKPSKNSRARCRQFIQKKKLSEHREYVEKEKTTEGTIAFLQKELTDSMDENRVIREEKKRVRIDMRNEQKKLLQERDEGWKKKIREREEEWKRCWERREVMVREEERRKRENEKQTFLQDRAKLFADKRKIELERDSLRERVEELEGELGDLKEEFLGYRS